MRAIALAEAEYGSVDLRLEGGTALAAFHLRHRESADLDFFGDPLLDARDFGRFLSEHLSMQRIGLTPAGIAGQGHARYLATSEVPEDAPVLLDIARSSPFRLEPPDLAAEGIRIASYRDLCAGKLHALCDRFEPRDFLDLHTILNAPHATLDPERSAVRSRFRTLLADVIETDPGLSVPTIAQALARGIGRPLVAAFPLRLLIPLDEERVQQTLFGCAEECGAIIRDGWNRS